MTRPPDDLAPGERLAHRLLDAIQFDRRFNHRHADAAPVREAVAAYYASTLTDADLRSLIAFFESSVGRKFVSVWQSDHSPGAKVMIADAPRGDDMVQSDGPHPA